MPRASDITRDDLIAADPRFARARAAAAAAYQEHTRAQAEHLAGRMADREYLRIRKAYDAAVDAENKATGPALTLARRRRQQQRTAEREARPGQGRLFNPPRKKKAKRPTGGDWNLDLWGGAGMEREGRTRAEQLELARDEMRRSGSSDLFDFLADQDKQHNPPRQIGGGRFRVSHVSPHDPSWQVWDDFLKRYVGQRQFTRRGAEAIAHQRSASAKRFSEPNPGGAARRALEADLAALRRQEAELSPRLIILSRKANKTEAERDELARLQDRGDELYERMAALRRRVAMANPADTPEMRYQRAVGHGERPATARKAAANPGRAVGRMSPNCPMCGALVRLPNPVPPRVTCHECGSESQVRRP